ncbi:MAG: bleomycin resistance protein [Candidatus Omnitrophica bacterium]|nr:bleomycin resistance protein [Candidatus Omnitrophota bacterium]
MPKVIRNANILLVRDVKASADYFVNQCGFKDPIYPAPTEDFCMLHRDQAELMLSQAPAEHVIVPYWKINAQLWNIYYWVDDVETLYAEMTTAGARIDYELCDQPWGCREFGIQDLDGHDIAFGQVIAQEEADHEG